MQQLQRPDTHEVVTPVKFHDGSFSDYSAVVTVLLKSLAQLAHCVDAERDGHVAPDRKHTNMAEHAIRRTIGQGALGIIPPDLEVHSVDAPSGSFQDTCVNPPRQLLRSELTDSGKEARLCAYDVVHSRP